MTTLIQFAILGLGIGTVYALLGQGLVLIYRGSGVVNFAHGAVAMLAAYLFWQLHVAVGLNFGISLLVTVIVTAALGVATYQLVMRPLGRASALARIISTLGIFMVLQGVALLIWGSLPKTLNSDLPTALVTIGGVSLGIDKLIMFAIAVIITAALWAVSRYTPLGLAIRANAENPRATSTLGWSPNLLGGITWGAGWGLAAVAGVLVAPLTGVTTDAMPLLVIPVLAAVLIGRLSSFWFTLLGAMVIGVIQSIVSNYGTAIPGSGQAVPFVIILVLLVFRRRSVLARSAGKQTLPTLGSGRVRWPWVVGVFVVIAVLMYWVLPLSLVVALTVTFAWGIVLLSVVVLLGYAGQLSLAQFALGGIAALVAGRLVVDAHLPFPLASLIALAVVMIVGVLFALPALRSRGIDLAIITLGLGATVSALIFSNGDLTGGTDGTPVGPQSFFGLSLDTIQFPRRWSIFVLIITILCALAVANVRRGRAGRRMIAVRTNERAAAALGIDVLRVKLYAFGLSAVIAGIGGILLAFRNPTILYSDFDPFQSILAVGYSFIGGVGFIVGAPMGATLTTGGFGSWVINEIFPSASFAWLLTVSGLFVLVFALTNPNGLIAANVEQFTAFMKRMRRHRPVLTTAPLVAPESRTVRPARLDVSDIVVTFGGVTAIDGATLSVEPGRIVGLIGPNGAGKTTLIDTITGFVTPASGRVMLDGQDVTSWPVHRRSRAGVSRSFQSLELFESSTVRENLAVASDPGDALSYVSDVVAPRRSPLSPTAVAAVLELNLEADLDVVVSDLPYGRRRLVAIARAIAGGPSILLLDEPAAGLSSVETMELAAVVRRLVERWGLGVLVIEHDMSFVMGLCDEVVVLNFGHQIARGTPDAVRRDPAVIEAYLGGQDEAPADDEKADVASAVKGR